MEMDWGRFEYRVLEEKVGTSIALGILVLMGEQGKDWEYLDRLLVKDEAWLVVWVHLMASRVN